MWRVEHRRTKQLYAMKEMSKARVLCKKSVDSVMDEKKLLEKLQHPFIVNINYAFQDRDNLYMIQDLLTGGDLRYHLGMKKKFTEQEAKFIIACIVQGLDYMHTQGVIHRDIKPENIVMEETGYVRITDMGIAKIQREENSKDSSGTPGYMAPEVMCRQNHTFSVDYFAVGVMLYEIMMGKRPYSGKTRKELRQRILENQVSIKREDLPAGWSLEAADFVNKCIMRKPAERLGLHGPAEVKQHIWLRDVDWQSLLEKSLDAPFKPQTEVDNFDKSKMSKADVFKGDDAIELQKNAVKLFDANIQKQFQGYEYFSWGAGMPIPAPSRLMKQSMAIEK